MLERMPREQLLNSIVENVRVWVRKRKPKTCAEAGGLADDKTEWKIGGEPQGRQATTEHSSKVLFVQSGRVSGDCPKTARHEEGSGYGGSQLVPPDEKISGGAKML